MRTQTYVGERCSRAVGSVVRRDERLRILYSLARQARALLRIFRIKGCQRLFYAVRVGAHTKDKVRFADAKRTLSVERGYKNRDYMQYQSSKTSSRKSFFQLLISSSRSEPNA